MADASTDRALGLVYLARRPQPWIAGLGYSVILAGRIGEGLVYSRVSHC